MRRQRNRRTRIRSVALAVLRRIGGAGILDGRTHMFRGRIGTSTSPLVGVLFGCVARVAREGVVGVGSAEVLLAVGVAGVVVGGGLDAWLSVVGGVVWWVGRLLLLLIRVRLVMRVDVLTSRWRREVCAAGVVCLLSRVACILLRWKIA